MPINFGCPGCGKTLRVGDENAGKLARCPDCGAVATIPAASANGGIAPNPDIASNPSSFPAPQAQPEPPNPRPSSDSNPSLRETALHPGSNSGVNSASWMMRTENGKAYGPVTKSTLDEWYQQGRIASFHFISSDHAQTWMASSDAYPQLRQTAATFQPSSPGASARSTNPFGDAPATTPYSAYAAPRAPIGPMGSGLPPGQGGLLLTLAILGFACCPVFSVVALILGIRELNEVSAGRLRPEAKGLAMASVIISAIALLLQVGGFAIMMVGDM